MCSSDLGAINHPRMSLFYPDETEVRNRIRWQKEIIKDIFSVKEIMDFEPSTLPCCNPHNYKVATIEDGISKNKLFSCLHK